LESKDISWGTFTISNLGMYPVDEFCAIINPPQSGIIAIGSVKKRLNVDKNEAIRIMSMFTVTASFDHRIVNGAQGGVFIEKFKKIFEEGM
jgi:pyruvate dehydrogenase E2 component (dihydrolipoamide acetyltransferase)